MNEPAGYRIHPGSLLERAYHKLRLFVKEYLSVEPVGEAISFGVRRTVRGTYVHGSKYWGLATITLGIILVLLLKKQDSALYIAFRGHNGELGWADVILEPSARTAALGSMVTSSNLKAAAHYVGAMVLACTLRMVCEGLESPVHVSSFGSSGLITEVSRFV